jgi:hemolysin III
LIEEGGDAGHNEGGGGGGGGVQSTLSHGNDLFGSINTSTNTKQTISSTTNQEEDSPDVDIEVIISGNFRREDLYDAFIHGIGLVLSLLGGIVLFIKARQVEGETGTRLLAGYILYEIGLLSLFFSSTLSHSLHMVDAHASLRLLSQSAIYLLIAGSYSPFFLVNLQHVQLGIYLFLAIWALALTGIALATSCGVRKGETIYTYTDRDWSGDRAVVFALMGWLALVPRQLVATCLDERGWKLLLVGGIFFGCGVGLYLIGRAQQVTRHRTVLSFWYILVLLACVIHWFAIYFFVEPPSEGCIKAAVDGGLQLREGKGGGGGGGGGEMFKEEMKKLFYYLL